MLNIGTLKSFNSTDYRAEVQLAGSMAAYLDNIPVARNIASDQMTVGRHVILAIPGGNPRDACVIAVWDGAAGGGGGIDDHAALTTGVHGLGISCRVTHSVNQTTTTGAMTTLAFDTEIWDTDNMHDNVTNNSRITFKTAGRYLIGLSVSWQTNATGERLFEIYKNGAPLEFTGSQLPPDAQNRCNQSGIMLTQFAVNDYIEAKVRQRSGGDLGLCTFYNASPIFWACCVEKL